MSIFAISQLFENAISQNENSQIEFIHGIPEILKVFPQAWIASKFLPFLVNWLPKNNPTIMSTLLPLIPDIANASGSLLPSAPLVEAILLSDNVEIAKQLTPILLQCSYLPHCLEFITQLSQSTYDCVRSYIPSIINLAGSDDSKRSILPTLVFDSSFRVRMEVLKYAQATTSEELSHQVAITLIKDFHSQIRSLIPVLCSQQQFYVSHILPKIHADPDWSVRMNVAKELIRCTDFESALKYCLILVRDDVWQVQYWAFKSLIKLLLSLKTSSYDHFVHDLVNEMIQRKQIPLRRVVIDVFFVADCKTPNFVDSVLAQPDPETKFYFVHSAYRKNKFKIIPKNQIVELINKILESDMWRIRKGVLDMFYEIAKIANDQQITHGIHELCIHLLSDEALPVREAAANQLVNFIPVDTAFDSNFPKFLIEFEESDNFRKRQIAILLLSLFIKKSNSANIKEFLLSRIRKFVNDPVKNVAQYANSILNLC